MAIPNFQFFMRPVLAVMADGEVRHKNEVRDTVLEQSDLTPEELEERLRGGTRRAGSRVHWATEYLVQAGALTRPKRGFLQITEVGQDLLTRCPNSISVHDLRSLEGFQQWVQRSRKLRKRRDVADLDDNLTQDADESPLEQLIAAVEVLDRATASDLIDRLRAQPPAFLEKAVLTLLHAMGYGGSDEDGEHLGRSHDGGLDGVIRQDALGLERVYVQVKRYKKDNTVGAAAIREFVGALTGVGASAGVFITTSDFSTDATRYAEHIKPRVILINGQRLGRLMVEYGVGVTTTQTIRVTEVDENFFEND